MEHELYVLGDKMSKRFRFALVVCSIAVASSAISMANGNSGSPSPNSLDGQGITKTPQLVRFTLNPDKRSSNHIIKFEYEPGLAEIPYTYIIELDSPSLAFNPTTSPLLLARKNKGTSRLNSISQSGSDVLNTSIKQLQNQQSDFLQQAKRIAPDVKKVADYQYALNGIALRVTPSQAQQIAELSGVKTVRREKLYHVQTDRGPDLIGSPSVWNGSNGIAQTQGEGIVVGIIDSGINTDHPSFAEISGDGYRHTNPLGDGVFLGDCAGAFPELCNNKLIGVYSYGTITNDYDDTSIFPPNLPKNGEDYGGHGSHVASIAAGNILQNVAEVLPEIGQERSSGVPTGFVFDRLSGVAPRANIISYQVCYGGRSDAGDTYADCPGSAIAQGIDSAIRDNVDVINFSISGGGNPWNDSTERAFLAAHNVGIFVATSAGNSGPLAESSDKNAPWYTSVAASEHGRDNAFVKELNDFRGGSSSLAPISGQSNSGSITAPIVYAGDFTNPNDTVGEPEQCLEPFPANTFNGEIVVCDRGSIARIEKAQNVAAGGAGGYVLANVDGGETFLANDEYVVPGIHINADDGNRLRTWLNSGVNHQATITQGVAQQVIDQSRVDVLVNFSSRGPNTTNSTLTPTMTAPGNDIYAANADEQIGHDGHEPAASDFSYRSGTSMSSPHVAGAAALLRAARPNWGPDEIRSALSLTTTQEVKKEDGETQADFFDMGAGRIRVDQAVNSGLVMSETNSNYNDANPAINGEPRALNIPSITDNDCVGTCIWSRTFTATQNATWEVTTDDLGQGLDIIATPSVFTLLEGQSQTIEFEINTARASKTEYAFANIVLSSPGLPEATVPVSIRASIGDIPQEAEINGRRDIDSILFTEIEAIDIADFNLTAYKPVKATVLEGTIFEDTENDAILDDLTDGVVVTELIVPDNSKRLVAEITRSSAEDLDLYIIYDANDDGFASTTEIIGESLSPDELEEVALNYPNPGRYLIIVQSFTASEAGSDEFELRYAVVDSTPAEESLRVIAPSSVSRSEPFDMRLIYELADSVSGEDYYAAVEMGTSSDSDDLGLITVDINRLDDDVFIDATPTRLDAGETVPLTLNIAGNLSNENRVYSLSVPLPVGTEFANFSTTNNGRLVNNELLYTVNKPVNNASTTTINFELRVLDGAEAGPIEISANSSLSNQVFSEPESTETFSKIQVEGAPSVSFNGNATASLTVIETKSLVIPLSVSEPNNDPVSIVWTQTSGPAAAVLEDDGVYSIVAPSVESDTSLGYDVRVSDPNNRTTTTSIEVLVLNNQSPVINSIDAPTSANGGQNITISVSATDPENDDLSIRIDGVLVNGNSRVVTTPRTGTQVSYTVSVSDGISDVVSSVQVNLTQAPPPSEDSGGGSLPWLVILLLPIAIIRRVYQKV